MLGDPCPCGWGYTDYSEILRECECCGRRFEKRPGYWVQVTEREDVHCTGLCEEKRQKHQEMRDLARSRIRYD